MPKPANVVLRALQRATVTGVALLALVGASAVWGLWSQSGALERIALDVVPRVSALEQVRGDLNQLQMSVLRFLGRADPDFSLAAAHFDQIDADLQRLGGADDPDTNGLRGDAQLLRAEVEKLRRGDREGPGAAAAAQLRNLAALLRSADGRIDRLLRRARADLPDGNRLLARGQQAKILVLGGMLVGALWGSVTFVFLRKRLRNPFRDLLQFLEAAAQKDLTGTLPAGSDDEVGALAAAASRLSATLVGTLRSLTTAAGDLGERGADLQRAAADAQAGAQDQLTRAAAGAQKAREVESALEPLDSLTGRLKEEAEQAASSIQQILAMTEQVQTEMEGLCSRVEAASDSVQDLDDATSRVAAVTAQLGNAAQEVAVAAESIDVASWTLREGAGEGRALAEDVAVRASSGQSSMREALGGMARIREAVDRAVQRFDRLGVELGRVDRVTQVIEDIAGRTNLLSLNAAIIASQAGEHGRAFGVVASEIRNLAEKTAASTREIRAIVEGVAAGGREAAEAIAEGVNRVKKGEEMVRKTGSLLDAIHLSADHAAERLREIDSVAQKQASEAGRVATEIRQVSQGVVSIVSEVRSEEERTRELRQNLSEMADVARQTVRAADEQSQGTGFITRTVMAVSHVAEQVDGALDKVGGLLRGLRSDLEVLDSHARQELGLVEKLADGGVGLASLAGTLHREVATFRLPEDPDAPARSAPFRRG